MTATLEDVTKRKLAPQRSTVDQTVRAIREVAGI